MVTTPSRHDKAMEYVDMALLAQRRGDQVRAQEFFQQAFVLERAAAERFFNRRDYEPTRSILYRSAANLALDIGDYNEASRLAHTALSGQPPQEIADEIWTLLDQTNFHRHLHLQGISLTGDEMHVSFDGDAFGPASARLDIVTKKLEDTQKVLLRTIARTAKQPFRTSAATREELRKFGPYWTGGQPLNHCFAAILKLSEPNSQLVIPEMAEYTPNSVVIDEFIECMELFASGDTAGLRERIDDEDYYRNFAALASGIAPDGKDVRLVGFTAQRRGEERAVALTRPASEISVQEIAPPTTSSTSRKPCIIESKKVTGELQLGDKTRRTVASIVVVDSLFEPHRIRVPKALIDDVVKPHWGQTVTVEYTEENGRNKTMTRLLPTPGDGD